MMARRPRNPQARHALATQLAHHRDIAQRINAREPAWDVMFGAGSWQFWAFAAWPAPRALILCDPDPAGLLQQMREAEAANGRLRLAVEDRRGGEAQLPPDPRRHGHQP